jgi:hypothetical protein
MGVKRKLYPKFISDKNIRIVGDYSQYHCTADALVRIGNAIPGGLERDGADEHWLK